MANKLYIFKLLLFLWLLRSNLLPEEESHDKDQINMAGSVSLQRREAGGE